MHLLTYFFIVANEVCLLLYVQTSKSLEVIFAQNFQAGSPDLSLSALLREEAPTDPQKSLFSTLRALLLAPNSAGFEISGSHEDAHMEDESENIGDRKGSSRENPQKSKSCSNLVKTICSTLDSAMAHIVAAYRQASSSSENLAAQSK